MFPRFLLKVSAVSAFICFEPGKLRNHCILGIIPHAIAPLTLLTPRLDVTYLLISSIDSARGTTLVAICGQNGGGPWVDYMEHARILAPMTARHITPLPASSLHWHPLPLPQQSCVRIYEHLSSPFQLWPSWRTLSPLLRTRSTQSQWEFWFVST